VVVKFLGILVSKLKVNFRILWKMSK